MLILVLNILIVMWLWLFKDVLQIIILELRKCEIRLKFDFLVPW